MSIDLNAAWWGWLPPTFIMLSIVGCAANGTLFALSRKIKSSELHISIMSLTATLFSLLVVALEGSIIATNGASLQSAVCTTQAATLLFLGLGYIACLVLMAYRSRCIVFYGKTPSSRETALLHAGAYAISLAAALMCALGTTPPTILRSETFCFVDLESRVVGAVIGGTVVICSCWLAYSYYSIYVRVLAVRRTAPARQSDFVMQNQPSLIATARGRRSPPAISYTSRLDTSMKDILSAAVGTPTELDDGPQRKASIFGNEIPTQTPPTRPFVPSRRVRRNSATGWRVGRVALTQTAIFCGCWAPFLCMMAYSQVTQERPPGILDAVSGLFIIVSFSANAVLHLRWHREYRKLSLHVLRWLLIGKTLQAIVLALRHGALRAIDRCALCFRRMDRTRVMPLPHTSSSEQSDNSYDSNFFTHASATSL